MQPLDDRTMTNLDFVLEEACRVLPHGGDHNFRRRVAEKLLASARSGNTTLGGLTVVAKAAVSDLASLAPE